ncbi:MAG: hypothetical protein V3T41_05385 [bacterium]
MMWLSDYNKVLAAVAVAAICGSAAHALVQIKGGANTALGELDGRYGGGLYASLGGEARLPWWNLAVMADLSYNTLGRDRPITKLFAEYAEKEYPGVLPWADVMEGLDLKSVFYGGSVGVRYYPVEHYFYALYAEAGAAYLSRHLTAHYVPVSVLGKYVLDLDFSVPATQGLGVYADVGLRVIPGVPLISADAGLRFTYAPGLGRTGFEDFLEENVPAFEAPESDNLFMVSFYVGASLF